jgi:hypothetical protein
MAEETLRDRVGQVMFMVWNGFVVVLSLEHEKKRMVNIGF